MKFYKNYVLWKWEKITIDSNKVMKINAIINTFEWGTIWKFKRKSTYFWKKKSNKYGGRKESKKGKRQKTV